MHSPGCYTIDYEAGYLNLILTNPVMLHTYRLTEQK